MSESPSFSIVINTLNRATLLQKTLESFRWLKYRGEFEVIVVNGPSTDHSDEVIAAWEGKIRAGKCDVANLSVSRNIGICMAQGDIVVFIDDDAIPEPEWLTQLAHAYEDPAVGAAGGRVYDHTGYTFQAQYCVVNRHAGIDFHPTTPTPYLAYPKSAQIPHLLGCNSSFRRSALLEIGGFDEEFEYFLDETDACLRIVDAGFAIAQLQDSYVHHKYAPSNLRSHGKVLRNRYPILKNKIYFSMKHAREFYSPEEVEREQKRFIQDHRNEVLRHVDNGELTKADRATFEADVKRALSVGLQRGEEGPRVEDGITAEKLERHRDAFLKFDCITRESSKNIVLISRDYPPDHGGGIATFSKDLAESMAAQGHTVHVITLSPDINRVDFENGVWLHRMVVSPIDRTPKALARNIPQDIWNWSATAFLEARRIALHRTIDVVEAPIWDCEAAAFLLHGDWPLVTSLHTTLHFWLESHPEMKQDVRWNESFGTPMLALERALMTEVHAVRANSHAIVKEIERAYGFTFSPERLRVVPHGMSDDTTISARAPDSDVTVLYVGRLEPRKGIDVLLASIPEVMQHCRQARFRIIGHDTSGNGSHTSYTATFRREHANQPWLDRVSFEGRVDESVLRQAYADCDIFVAPSRFESFGLVFLEAMRAGKPVIGCDAGGMPEVVADQVNGLLVPPGDAPALTRALVTLLNEPQLRQAMGAQSKIIFDAQFTSARMGNESIALYAVAQKNFENESA